MTAKKKLLDSAAERCSPANYVGLAARLGITTSLVSAWKLDRYPMPAERVAELARIAHLDAGEWLLLVEAEQSHGEARKAYGALVKRLGIAALLAIVTGPAMASHFVYSGLVMPIMSAVRRALTGNRQTLERRRSADHAPMPALQG